MRCENATHNAISVKKKKENIPRKDSFRSIDTMTENLRRV